MEFFAYREAGGGRALFAEDVALTDIAARVGTPVYVYSSGALVARYRAYQDALPDALVCYSIKANDNLAVIRTLARHGAGADVVSGGELKRALAAGVAPNKIVFAGVGKTRDELAAGLEAGILQFNVESDSEIETLAELAAARNLRAPIALRINPDVDARTHDKISTGRRSDKFGIAWDRTPELFARAAAMASIDAVGLAVHIGSQLTSLAPFEAAFGRVADLTRELRAAGQTVRRVNLGGGLGIRYAQETPPALEDYTALVRGLGESLGVDIVVEPGRNLAGPAGVLLTRVLYLKHTAGKAFAIVDAGMNDLLRPTLYSAWHDVQAVRETPGDAARETVDIVGPVCESGDILAEGRALPPLKPGDLLAIRDAGAYGAVMSSAYNSRPPAAEALVRGDGFAVIRPRLSYEALLGRDVLPDWLS